jgi:hypothetical protein
MTTRLTTSRVLVCLRCPAAGTVELAITRDGETAVYPLNLDQLKLLALQIVRALASWPEGQS